VIHEPHLADPDQLATAGIILDQTYPRPIVDHAEARERALNAYKQALE
ncbi:MAG: FAD-binding domain-containing protein, partial [Acidimicrobiia bacterium]|nr:FAD-binding domain-containing protein [Acidimicrobiia bacterium]